MTLRFNMWGKVRDTEIVTLYLHGASKHKSFVPSTMYYVGQYCIWTICWQPVIFLLESCIHVWCSIVSENSAFSLRVSGTRKWRRIRYTPFLGLILFHIWSYRIRSMVLPWLLKFLFINLGLHQSRAEITLKRLSSAYCFVCTLSQILVCWTIACFVACCETSSEASCH